MENKNILIPGAGIAGPTLAWWLKKYGFNPVIVERAPKLREGGYAIDFVVWMRQTITNIMMRSFLAKWFVKKYMTDNIKLKEYKSIGDNKYNFSGGNLETIR